MTLERILFHFVVASIATASFGLLFRTEARLLLPGAVIGGIGYIVYDVLVLLYGSTALAAFAAGAMVGLCSEAAARVLRCPSIVFATMGIIPLVPGYGLYQTMELVVQADYARALAMGMETLLVAGSIAMSLGFATVVARRLLRKKAKRIP